MSRSRTTPLAEPRSGRWTDTRGAPLLRWALLTGACLFGLQIAWTLGLLQRVLLTDTTGLSAALILIYLAAAAYGGWRALELSRAHQAFERLRETVRSRGEPPQPVSRYDWSIEYCLGLRRPQADRAALREVLEEQARGPHEAGWFVSSALLKLGLLGTIVGFMFMLGALDALKTLTYADLPQMLGRMGSGMGISLYTTLVALLANIALGWQNVMLDRSAERLVAGTLAFAEDEWQAVDADGSPA